MSDIVDRLQNASEEDAYMSPWTFGTTCKEAAREIERLAAVNTDLLAALRVALPILDKNFRVHREMQSGAGMISENLRAVETARAAIARAEGGADAP